MDALEATLRHSRGRIVAHLARSLGLAQLALAEDAVQTAALRALETWPAQGVPANPGGWLYRVARHAAIDRLRAEARFEALPDNDGPVVLALPAAPQRLAGELDDDELALLFALCRPEIPLPTQVALALRALGGLELDAIADGLLTTPAALAQRLARARTELRDADLGLPAGPELAARREAVLSALLLMFNAGWQGRGDDPKALCWEAIRLARAVAAHPWAAHPDADALAALLLFHGARLTGRIDAAGDIVPLPGQPRDRWDMGLVRMGFAHLQRGQRATQLSRFHLQAGIAGEHAIAPDYARTNWRHVLNYYEALVELDPSAAPRLGHAIALAEAGSPQEARLLLEALLPEVPAPLRAHTLAALAHALARLGENAIARARLAEAIVGAPSDADRRLLQRRAEALQRTP
jgi:RNA polymerase sigma-70 factor (ECF subfamily)